MIIRMNLIKYLTCLIVLAALQSFSQTTQNAGHYLRDAAISQDAGSVHIQANSPRPLAQVLDALHRKYGWTIDYEDPQYLSPMDTTDAPSDASSPRLPSGGSFGVEFPASSLDEEKTLRLVVDFYNQSKNPGRFELRRSAPDRFHVVGIAARDEKGAVSPQPVLLDSPVTLPIDERSITETVNLICQEITAQSHSPVTIGVSPRSVLDHSAVKVGGTKVSARDLLLQALTASHHNIYWRLLFDPASKGYFLDMHMARR
jgi:hypothetical protein